MEETKLKKQNTFLKVILLLLCIPVIAVVSIVGYMFLPGLISGTAEPWEKNDNSKVTRSAPQKDEPSPSPTPATVANSVPANVNTTPTPNVAPAPNTSAFPFVGKWSTTRGGSKMTYVFEAPKKVGNTQTGAWIVRAAEGKEYLSIYTIVSSNKLQVREEGGSDSRDYIYVISADGKSLELTSDGNTIYLSRSR